MGSEDDLTAPAAGAAAAAAAAAPAQNLQWSTLLLPHNTPEERNASILNAPTGLLTPCDFFRHFFPTRYILDEILPATNEAAKKSHADWEDVNLVDFLCGWAFGFTCRCVHLLTAASFGLGKSRRSLHLLCVLTNLCLVTALKPSTDTCV